LTKFPGNEFQTVGAATEKARLAKTVRVRGTASLGVWVGHLFKTLTGDERIYRCASWRESIGRRHCSLTQMIRERRGRAPTSSAARARLPRTAGRHLTQRSLLLEIVIRASCYNEMKRRIREKHTAAVAAPRWGARRSRPDWRALNRSPVPTGIATRTRATARSLGVYH